MIRLSLLLFFMLISACSTMHKSIDTSIQTRIIDSLDLHSATIESSTSLAFITRDSINSDYLMEIYPKGVFTYSWADGFNGEADRILVKASVKKGTVRHSISESHEQGSRIDVNKLKKDLQSKDQVISKSNFRFGTRIWIVLSCLIFAFLFYCYWKYR